jgi:hypothetical protein
VTDSPVPPPPPPAMPAPSGRPLGQPATVILLAIVTLGIYGFVYWYKTFSELKEYNGDGIGGPIGLVLGIFVSIANPFILGSEIKSTYDRAGQTSPVSAVTGFWVLIPLLGYIIYIVKSQGALNSFWEARGGQ